MLFCCLWLNVETSCHKHSSSSPAINKLRRLLTAISVQLAMTFGMEKLEWCCYPTVEKFWRYVYSFWQNPRTRQTQTHRQTPHDGIGRAFMHSIARPKVVLKTSCSKPLVWKKEANYFLYMTRTNSNKMFSFWHQPTLIHQLRQQDTTPTQTRQNGSGDINQSINQLSCSVTTI